MESNPDSKGKEKKKDALIRLCAWHQKDETQKYRNDGVEVTHTICQNCMEIYFPERKQGS